eukprot:1063209-Rhodomonas_salina.1
MTSQLYPLARNWGPSAASGHSRFHNINNGTPVSRRLDHLGGYLTAQTRSWFVEIPKCQK